MIKFVKIGEDVLVTHKNVKYKKGAILKNYQRIGWQEVKQVFHKVNKIYLAKVENIEFMVVATDELDALEGARNTANDPHAEVELMYLGRDYILDTI